jgi:hypothetical protein
MLEPKKIIYHHRNTLYLNVMPQTLHRFRAYVEEVVLEDSIVAALPGTLS